MWAVAAGRSCGGRAVSGRSPHAPPRRPPRGTSSLRHPAASSSPFQRLPQLLLQPRRDRVPTARQRADNHPIAGAQFVQDGAGDVPEPTCYPVPIDRVPNGSGDHKADPGPAAVVVRAGGVHDEVGLHHSHPLIDRGTEFRRPRHPVSGRKHRARSCVGSGSQRAATLTTPIGHDRAAGAGPHPQPKPMHPRPTPVVGLEGPLALGHGCISSLRMASACTCVCRCGAVAVGKLIRLACRRGLRKLPGRSRIATCGRLFEGTDEISLGQTSPLPDG
jgi:hypothetical protein